MSREWANGVCRVGPIKCEIGYNQKINDWWWVASFVGGSNSGWVKLAGGFVDTEPAARAACEPYLPPEMPVVEWDDCSCGQCDGLILCVSIWGGEWQWSASDEAGLTITRRGYKSKGEAQVGCCEGLLDLRRIRRHERIFGEVQS